MIVSAHLIPFWLNLPLCLVMLGCVAGAVRKADWSALRAVPARQHVLLAGLLGLLLLWLLTLKVIDGVWIHLLGVTSLTLIVGWRFTIVGATLVLLAQLWLQSHSLFGAPLAWLLTVFLPATTSRLLAYLLRRYGFRNLFVFMLGAGFGGGLLSVLLQALAGLLIFGLIGQAEWVARALANWPLIALLMFPEGFINGMLVTALTVFYPEVVKTFDDAFYLDDREG
ncbi:MAG: energy-coupling factor ABC transporter permease [Pseudomonadota bacterium]